MRSVLYFVAILAAYLLASVNASAQALPVAYPQTLSGNTWTFAASSATSANAASLQFLNAANGPVYAQATQRISLGGTAVADVVVRSSPSAANIAGALGRFAGKTLPVLATGVALYDLGKELGFEFVNTTGTFEVSKSSNIAPGCGNPPANKIPTSGSGCYGNYAGGIYFLVTSITDNGAGQCNIYGTCSNGSYPNTFLAGYPKTGINAPALPSTVKEFTDAVAAKSGWPSTSAINRALADAVASGEAIPLPAPNTLTGPASVPLPPTVVTNPDGSKVTTTQTKNIVYAPPAVTVTDSTTVSNTSPTGVVTAGPTTTGAAQPVEKPKDPCGLPDTPVCKLDATGIQNADDVDLTRATKPYDKVKELVTTPTSVLPAIPSINWAFALPSACSNIPTPAFAPFMSSIDICQFQPMFHEIMSMVWILGGLFGAISLFMKSSLGDA